MPPALCLEQTLGHRAHSANLEAALKRLGAEWTVVKVEHPGSGRLPWAAAGSWLARRRLKTEAPNHAVQFFHTQSIALLAPQEPVRHQRGCNAGPDGCGWALVRAPQRRPLGAGEAHGLPVGVFESIRNGGVVRMGGEFARPGLRRST